MEPSILTSTKKVLGIAETYTAFDLDILTHINSSFSTLDQLGVGPAGGATIEDARAEWDSLELPQNQLNMVRTYVFLRVRLIFDPPSTSFAIAAMEKQLEEHVWRLNVFREEVLIEEELETEEV